jgi:DNA-binding FadR family transcriptional regulator
MVHAPSERNAARAISLVLQSQHVSLRDVGAALLELEPVCAVLCAAREDRAEAVVPRLRERHEAACRAAGDGLEFTRAARRFHEEIVDCCENRTLILVVSALELLWARGEDRWAEQATEDGGFPSTEHRTEGNRAHERLIELIEAGDLAAVASTARRHLEATQRYALSGETDSPVLLQNV